MTLFRVQLEKWIGTGGLPRNPFLCRLDVLPRIQFSVREWEIEAKSETEARELLAEAYTRKLPNVRGYRLRSIDMIREGLNHD